jgi:HSP20 family molecular chaperone IbpA
MTTDDNHRNASSLLDVLRHVVETLQDAERSGEGDGTGSGTVSGRFARTDYGFTVSTGPDPDSLWDRLGGDESSQSSNSTPTQSSDEEYLVDVREEEDGVLVLADLPQATAEEITAGIDRERGDLVIGIEGGATERIPLGDANIVVADSSFNNGVLEVRLGTADSSTEGQE